MKNISRKEFMVKNVKIDTVDDRGWYIVAGGINGGVDYLYSDGIIREGVYSAHREDASAFWPTEELARSFFEKWAGNDAEFWAGLGMK